MMLHFDIVPSSNFILLSDLYLRLAVSAGGYKQNKGRRSASKTAQLENTFCVNIGISSRQFVGQVLHRMAQGAAEGPLQDLSSGLYLNDKLTLFHLTDRSFTLLTISCCHFHRLSLLINNKLLSGITPSTTLPVLFAFPALPVLTEPS